MAKQLKRFDVSDYLNDEETMAEYLNAIMEDGDPDLLLAAIGDVAKARGMKQIAQEHGINYNTLQNWKYRGFLNYSSSPKVV